MFKKRKGDKNTYGIVGLGRFGEALAKELLASGAELIVMDRNEEKIREFREYTENAYVIHNLERKTLEETGIQNCDVAVVCMSEKLDQSILLTLHLVELGIPHVISKSASAEHGKILEKLGAEVVYPERDMGIRLAKRLEASRMLDFIQLSEELNLSKLFVPQKLIGKTVLEAHLRDRFGINIIAVENGTSLTDVVRPDYTFKPGDILYICGRQEGIGKLSEYADA